MAASQLPKKAVHDSTWALERPNAMSLTVTKCNKAQSQLIFLEILTAHARLRRHIHHPQVS
eukprot:4257118-Amphidinium_carterae.1